MQGISEKRSIFGNETKNRMYVDDFSDPYDQRGE